jgi:hypothetical protein
VQLWQELTGSGLGFVENIIVNVGELLSVTTAANFEYAQALTGMHIHRIDILITH